MFTKGFLWRHDDGDRGARAFNAYTAQDLQKNYQLDIVGSITLNGCVQASLSPPVLSRATSNAHPSGARSSGTQQALSSWVASVLRRGPYESFSYHRPMRDDSDNAKRDLIANFTKEETAAMVVDYDLSAAALQRYPLKPAQRVLFLKGPRAGRTAVIIGVFHGRLVRQEDNDFPKVLP